MFGASAGSAYAENGANPDASLLDNWVEYALALDPLDPSDDVLPAWHADGELFTLTFRRPVDACDVTYQVVGTGALGSDWTPVAVTETVVPVDAEVEEVTFTVSASTTVVTPYFYRLLIRTTLPVLSTRKNTTP